MNLNLNRNIKCGEFFYINKIIKKYKKFINDFIIFFLKIRF